MGEKSSQNVAVICDGKEIAFGMNLLHLIKYAENGIELRSIDCQSIIPELYTIATFRNTNIPLNTHMIFIGEVQSITPNMKKVFDKFGMSIWIDDSVAVLRADASSLKDNNYYEFLEFANSMRMEYLKKEEDYARAVEVSNQNWIVQQFVKVQHSSGLFGQGNSAKKKIQQQYDCLAFIYYMKFLCKDLMR